MASSRAARRRFLGRTALQPCVRGGVRRSRHRFALVRSPRRRRIGRSEGYGPGPPRRRRPCRARLPRPPAEIDPAQTGLWGFSNGAWVATIAASRLPACAFLLLTGASAVSPAEQEVYRRTEDLRRRASPRRRWARSNAGGASTSRISSMAGGSREWDRELPTLRARIGADAQLAAVAVPEFVRVNPTCFRPGPRCGYGSAPQTDGPGRALDGVRPDPGSRTCVLPGAHPAGRTRCQRAGRPERRPLRSDRREPGPGKVRRRSAARDGPRVQPGQRPGRGYARWWAPAADRPRRAPSGVSRSHDQLAGDVTRRI